MDHMIPLSIPNFKGNKHMYVDDAIDQGWVSTDGAYITKLEQELANWYVASLHYPQKRFATLEGTS